MPSAPVSDALRARLLRELWGHIRTSALDNVLAAPAAARAIDAGADPVDLAGAMTSAAYDAVFGVLYLLDYHSETETETEGDGDAVHGWVLVDADHEDGDLVPAQP